MKLAFSTISCPDWDFYRDIFAAAKDLGYQGIEIRGIKGEIYAPNIPLFSDDTIENTVKKLAEGRLEISCLTSGACLGAKGSEEKADTEAKAYIDLAEKLKVKYVRVMPTGNPFPDQCDKEQAKRLYKKLAVYGEKKGVTPIMETNGIFADTLALKEFMESIGEKNIGVLWDINHPVRFNGEDVSTTLKNIGKFIKYVHLKDSEVVDGNIVYRLLGKGTLPVEEAIDGLKKICYDGYLSLEWVKRWNKNLEEPGLVLPYYINYMYKHIC